MSEIADLIRKLTESRSEALIMGRVASVSKEKRSCNVSPLDESADILGVKLMADKTTGLLLIPKKGSIVLVSMINKSQGFVSMFSELEEILLNGEEFEGLVKAPELRTELDKTNAALKQVIDLLKSWTVAPSDGGLALQTAAKLIFATTKLGDFSNIQNKTVKHGKG